MTMTNSWAIMTKITKSHLPTNTTISHRKDGVLELRLQEPKEKKEPFMLVFFIIASAGVGSYNDL